MIDDDGVVYKCAQHMFNAFAGCGEMLELFIEICIVIVVNLSKKNQDFSPRNQDDQTLRIKISGQIIAAFDLPLNNESITYIIITRHLKCKRLIGMRRRAFNHR